MRPKEKATRLRAGLWEYRNHAIELRDEAAEVYHGELDYGLWTISYKGERWLSMYPTLKEAKIMIDIHIRIEADRQRNINKL